MKSNRKELSNRMKEHEKGVNYGQIWELAEREVEVPPSFSVSFNLCSNSKYGVVT